MKDIERMVVSAHVDGEVESPWNEKIAAKLATDSEWAAEAERHRGVKAALADDAEPDFTASLKRVMTAIEVGSPQRLVRSNVSRLPVWITAAAAVLLVLAAGGGYMLGRQTTASAVAEIQVEVPKQLPLKLSGEGQLIMASTLQGNRP